ncbi:MAG: HU family DNA-binding protein [Rickettsiaceae bacterium]|nr:HU family DNA-binding protein [Rickettsiaceae bacterium]
MIKSCNKLHIASILANRIGLSHRICLSLTSKLFTIIIDILKQDKELNIKNFGKFALRQKKLRPGRDILRGKSIDIPARTVVAFLASRNFREHLNKK